MDKPRPGKTTFVIMVSPLPAPSLPASSTQLIHALATNSPRFAPTPREIMSSFTTRSRTSSLCAEISTYDTPHPSSRRELPLPSSPRPALLRASLLPRRPAEPTRGRAPSGGSDVDRSLFSSHPPPPVRVVRVRLAA
ncbi:hypothetical protein J1605_022855 [Eschrichtius robustus]|uniref:Uncharacterized protein n=1 Tax=Eschrichtius robustus TaxID=9764 RepID=A0AB34H5Y4_ESCRO|nr:hypothetical protein J1605_022855 [Eschrichtius robustus]